MEERQSLVITFSGEPDCRIPYPASCQSRNTPQTLPQRGEGRFHEAESGEWFRLVPELRGGVQLNRTTRFAPELTLQRSLELPNV
jgi:hypothetical protein